MTDVEDGMRSRGCKPPRGKRLGAPLALGLIIIALTATVFIDFTSLTTPPAVRIKMAVIGAATIRTAAETLRRRERTTHACPTVQDLVRLEGLDSKRINDPWGTPYQIRCEGAFIRVTSAGKDRRLNSPDDIHDEFKPSDIERVDKL